MMRGEACNTLVVLLVRCPHRPDRNVKVTADYPHRTHKAIVNSRRFPEMPGSTSSFACRHALGPSLPSGSRDWLDQQISKSAESPPTPRVLRLHTQFALTVPCVPGRRAGGSPPGWFSP